MRDICRTGATRGRSSRALAFATAATVALLGAGASVLTAPATQAADGGGSTLVTETFKGAKVADSRWVPLGDGCLTGAHKDAAADGSDSRLGGCRGRPVRRVIPAQGR